MRFFKKHGIRGLFSTVIQCEQKDYLVQKCYQISKTDEYSEKKKLKNRSLSLYVKDGEVAVVLHKKNSVTVKDYVVGPFFQRDKFKISEFTSDNVDSSENGNSYFEIEVYFINLANVIQIHFAVPYFDLFDTQYPNLSVPVAVRGRISFKISDYQNFVKIYSLNDFCLDTFNEQIKSTVCRRVKEIILKAPAKYNISVVKLESEIQFINDVIKDDLYQVLLENFGVYVPLISVDAIDIDKTSGEYAELVSRIRNNDNSNKFSTRPKIPSFEYCVIQNDKICGPYAIQRIKDMIVSGEISRKDLMWKDGMPDWCVADSIDELKCFFNDRRAEIKIHRAE